MGLDSYLRRGKRIPRKSVKEIDIIENEIYFGDDRELLKKYKDYVVTNIVNEEERYYLTEEVGYFRKANAIHKWFVDNVQGGNDDCSVYEVTKAQLEDLLNTVSVTLDAYTSGDLSKVESLLPTQSGFFFGSTEYNDSYKQDLLTAIDILSKVLSTTDFETHYVAYTSSW